MDRVHYNGDGYNDHRGGKCCGDCERLYFVGALVMAGLVAHESYDSEGYCNGSDNSDGNPCAGLFEGLDVLEASIAVGHIPRLMRDPLSANTGHSRRGCWEVPVRFRAAARAHLGPHK